MLIRGCDVTVTLIFGTIADAMFLGGIGLLAASIFDNLPVAIMLPMIYYAVSITMKSKLGNFNLFAMMIGNYHSNLWLFATGTIMIASSLIIKKVIMKCR